MTKDGGEAKLTLGPVLFNWSPECWRDFYFAVADESSVAEVYIGETVCSKRQPFFEPVIAEVIERLEKSGKKIILSSLSLIMTGRERHLTQDLARQDDYLVEANDISAHALLRGKPHHIGPLVNVYNEGTIAILSGESATRICLPQELSFASIKILAASAKKLKTEVEVQSFGRIPLALSGRCYHARLHGLSKDSCQFVCAQDPDGLDVKTLDKEPFLAMNGIQTMSFSYLDLMAEMAEMRKAGVTHFRLSPHSRKMTEVCALFQKVLNGKIDAAEGRKKLRGLLPDISFSNGFYHGLPGHVIKSA